MNYSEGTAAGAGHQFGTLRVEGDVSWLKGIYRPEVDGTAGSTTADVWEATGTFRTFGIAAGNWAVIAPGAINVPPGANLAGRTWVVLKGDLMEVPEGGAIRPTFPPNDPNWLWDLTFGDAEWKIKHT